MGIFNQEETYLTVSVEIIVYTLSKLKRVAVLEYLVMNQDSVTVQVSVTAGKREISVVVEQALVVADVADVDAVKEFVILDEQEDMDAAKEFVIFDEQEDVEACEIGSDAADVVLSGATELGNMLLVVEEGFD